MTVNPPYMTPRGILQPALWKVTKKLKETTALGQFKSKV